MEVKDRFKGCILGAAVGDALGMPTEYITQAQLDTLYNGRVTTFQNPSKSHPCGHLKAGQYTDDTQQIIVLGNSIVKNKGFNFLDFAKDLGVWGNRCTTESDYDRFAGTTSLSAALEIYVGKDPNLTGKPRATCGAAMRIAPVGLFYSNDINKMQEVAKDAARITHCHSEAIASAVFVSGVIAYLLNDKNHFEAVNSARSLLNGDLGEKLDYVISKNSFKPKEISKVIGTSEDVCETVPMALSCFLYSPENFEETVVQAANLVCGDTDSIACIAGAISGAYNGYSKIPQKFKDNLENRLGLEKLSEDLLEKSLNQTKLNGEYDNEN